MKLSLRDFLSVEAKSKIKAGDGQVKGDYKFFTSSPVQSKFINSWLYDAEALVFGTGGNASVHYVNDKFSTSTDCLVMTNKMPKAVNLKCIYYYLAGNIHLLAAGFKGCELQHISKDFILNIKIDLPERAIQDEIVAVFDLLTTVRIGKEKQLQKFDDIVKSQFIEMFGDPELNPYNFEKVTLNDVCSSIVRGPFGSALKKEFFVAKQEGVYKVYEQRHAIQKSSQIGTYYIDAQKFNELKRFECRAGDFLMSCSGTMGELYQLPENCEKGIINQALCKFTLNSKILPIYFLTYMESTIGNLETKGSGIKNIAAVSFVKAMPVLVPPIELQNEFARFVEQTDKSKDIDELEVAA